MLKPGSKVSVHSKLIRTLKSIIYLQRTFRFLITFVLFSEYLMDLYNSEIMKSFFNIESPGSTPAGESELLFIFKC